MKKMRSDFTNCKLTFDIKERDKENRSGKLLYFQLFSNYNVWTKEASQSQE